MKKVYVDPYINPQTGTLKNLLGITNNEELRRTEAEMTGILMRELNQTPVKGNFDFAHLCQIHEKIFGDIYEWAGTQRIIDIEKPERALGGLSVEYSQCDEIQRNASMILTDMKKVDWEGLPLEQKAAEFSRYMADLWKVHPFREGNTRTTVTFCCDFAESRGFGIDKDLFKDHSEYVRTALVAASAKFSDSLGDRSQPEHLYRIVKDGMERWAKDHHAQDKEIRMDGHAQGSKMSMSDYKNKISKARESVDKEFSAEPKREHEKSDSRRER